jgi:hypothetical protein
VEELWTAHRRNKGDGEQTTDPNMQAKVISLMLAIVLANIVCAAGAESTSNSEGKK